MGVGGRSLGGQGGGGGRSLGGQGGGWREVLGRTGWGLGGGKAEHLLKDICVSVSTAQSETRWNHRQECAYPGGTVVGIWCTRPPQPNHPPTQNEKHFLWGTMKFCTPPTPCRSPGGGGGVTWSTQNFSLQLIVLLCG